MRTRLLLMICLFVGAAALCRPAALTAGKPTTPPPPPPSGDPTLIYVYRPDLGGWLDTSRNLLWGTYSLNSCVGGSMPNDQAAALAADYAATLADGSLYYDERSAYWQAQGDLYVLSDPARAARHYQTAQDCADAADELFAQSLAASVVEGTNKWRLPSKAEFEDAYSKGMFTYGDGGLNGFDKSPTPGIQPEKAGFRYWTSTVTKNRYQWSIDPVAGLSYSEFIIGSRLYAVAVRDYTPPTAP